jgi:nucleoside phosphorylase
VFLVGVAGGLKEVNIGDVVVATKVYGYESGKASNTFKPRPEIGLSTYRMIQRAQAVARNQQWMQWIKPVPQQSPRAKVAPIAAGDKVINSTKSSIWKLLKQSYGDALAVEMEGYGFLQAVYGNPNVDALIIRGISDLIEGKSEADTVGSQELAARHASAFAFEVLSRLSQDDLGRISKSGKGPLDTSNQPVNSADTVAPMDDHIHLQNYGSIQGIIQGGSNHAIQNFITNAPVRDEIAEGKVYLKRGQTALLDGNHSDARQYLEAANLLLREDQCPHESAQVKYLQALALLKGIRPFGITIQVWLRVEELMQATITLHAAYSYLYTFALFKHDFARNGLRKSQYIQEAQKLMEEAERTPVSSLDDDNIALLWKCQSILMSEVEQ